MAKMFYTAAEAAKRLGKTEESLKELVRDGSLREFRDGDSVSYKVSDVDALAPDDVFEDVGSPGSSGEVVLEPAEDSDVRLAGTGSDILSLEEIDSGDTSGATTSAGTKGDTTTRRKKGDTVVPSVGVNVFDDDELDEAVDPLAQTAVTDVGGLGLDGVGSGSGILDLTKESDDTSLGAELLEEIYSGEDEAGSDMGEATRAGLDAAPEEPEGDEAFEAEVEGKAAGPEPVAAPRMAAMGAVLAEPATDALSTSLTALVAVAIVVMWFAGLAGAALVRGVVPGLLNSVYAHLAMYAGGALGVAVLAGAVTFLLARRSP